MDATVKAFESFLQQRGMRLTKHRTSILKYIVGEDSEFTSGDIFASIECEDVAMSTIYEVLGLLLDGKFIEKVPSIEKASKFRITVNANIVKN